MSWYFESRLQDELGDYYDDFSERGLNVVKCYANEMQLKFEKQSQELDALRAFALEIFKNYTEDQRSTQSLGYYLSNHLLIDEYLSPTYLLTGSTKI